MTERESMMERRTAENLAAAAVARFGHLGAEHVARRVALACTMAAGDEFADVVGRVRRAAEALPAGGAVSRDALLALLDQIERDRVTASEQGGER